MRRFTWWSGRRHRPGLGYSASTGRLHGLESLAERRLLLMADFAAEVQEMVSQPFPLRFRLAGGWVAHVPDFAIFDDGGGVKIVDVRPAARVQRADAVKFAATARLAVAAGWSCLLVVGWRPHVAEVIEAVAARRRAMRDPLGVRDRLLAGAQAGPVRLGRLVAVAQVPAAARAHLLDLIWQRRLAIDLARPLNDGTWRPGRPAQVLCVQGLRERCVRSVPLRVPRHHRMGPGDQGMQGAVGCGTGGHGFLRQAHGWADREWRCRSAPPRPPQ
ncbi:TnsA-like heteromeric transposase endonuclease subunit [Streptomyces sp. NBC_00631]